MRAPTAATLAVIVISAIGSLGSGLARAETAPLRLTNSTFDYGGPASGSTVWKPARVSGASVRIDQPISVKGGKAAFSFERDFSSPPHWWDIADADRVIPFGKQVDVPTQTWHHVLGCFKDVEGRCVDANYLCQGELKTTDAANRTISARNLTLGPSRYRLRAYDVMGTYLASLGQAFAIEIEMPVVGDPDISALRCYLNASDLGDFGAGPTTRDIEQIFRSPQGDRVLVFQSPAVADASMPKTVSTPDSAPRRAPAGPSDETPAR